MLRRAATLNQALLGRPPKLVSFFIFILIFFSLSFLFVGHRFYSRKRGGCVASPSAKKLTGQLLKAVKSAYRARIASENF